MPLTDIDGQRLGDSVGDKLGNRNLLINGAMQVRQRSDSTGSQQVNMCSIGFNLLSIQWAPSVLAKALRRPTVFKFLEG